MTEEAFNGPPIVTHYYEEMVEDMCQELWGNDYIVVDILLAKNLIKEAGNRNINRIDNEGFCGCKTVNGVAQW